MTDKDMKSIRALAAQNDLSTPSMITMTKKVLSLQSFELTVNQQLKKLGCSFLLILHATYSKNSSDVTPSLLLPMSEFLSATCEKQKSFIIYFKLVFFTHFKQVQQSPSVSSLITARGSPCIHQIKSEDKSYLTVFGPEKSVGADCRYLVVAVKCGV